jgi:hypothetical protein
VALGVLLLGLGFGVQKLVQGICGVLAAAVARGAGHKLTRGTQDHAGTTAVAAAVKGTEGCVRW